MAGRALAFSDAEIVRLARQEYVSIACDDWYQRRRQDAEGQFFINVANQGPRKGAGGDTRQGIYVLTASGNLLAWKNAGQNPPVMLELLRDGLRKWKQLSESERAPGAVKVPPQGKVDATYHRAPPPGGAIIKVYGRALDTQQQPVVEQAKATPKLSFDLTSFSDAQCPKGRGDEASRDHLWLTEAEWKSLIPAQLRAGAKFPLPAKIAERILRFHLVDNTRGEPPLWRRSEIRSQQLDLVLEEVTAETVRLRLEGSAILATDANLEKAVRGYTPRLQGYITYSRNAQRLTRFDVVAIGGHWGNGPHTRRNTRDGRAPLGVAFELAAGDSPADRIAPQGARWLNDYFGR